MRILILIIVIVLIFVVYISTIIKSMKISFGELANVSFSGFNFNSLNVNQTVIATRLKLIVTFNSFFRISISNLNIKAYINQLLIAESTKGILENTKKIILIPNIQNEIYQTFDFHINSELITLIAKLKTKQPYKIDYTATFKIFGITIKKTGTHENN